MKINRLVFFQIFFIGINLSFIPLISLYGLQSCPVLSIPGFGFGCYYSGIYIFLVNLFNLSGQYFIKNEKFRPFLKSIKLNEPVFLFLIYLVSTLAALLFLHTLLNFNHLTSKSRAPEILFFASLMLGILQSYGMTWADFKFTNNLQDKNLSIDYLWAHHILRTILPFAVVVSVILHFIISQAIEFNDGHTAPLASHDGFIKQITYLIIFLVIWLIVVFSFQFMSEKDQLKKVQTHFDQLAQLNFSFTTHTKNSWGLWLAIINQLNSFSKILGEKTRLVKSFSKFVTAGVVQQVLQNDSVNTKGVTKELTVIMTDIRDFTTIAENLNPDQVVTLLNEYFAVMLEIASEYDISVDKFIGDGILAYVDNQITVSDPMAENRKAVSAALSMIKALNTLNPKLIGLGLPPIKIGIGIYRGPLVIGLIGSDSKLQHTIIGDTVNRTARLESLCKDFDVSIVIASHIWYSLTPDMQSQFTSFGKTSVKGLKSPMEVFGAKI